MYQLNEKKIAYVVRYLKKNNLTLSDKIQYNIIILTFIIFKTCHIYEDNIK